MLLPFLVAALTAGNVRNVTVAQGIADLSLLIATVNDLRGKLGIPDPIEVVLVEKVDYAVSVARHPEDRRQFRIQFEREFLNRLTANEIRAALAHELGHVWIFTHHPYLQTEELANQVAAKAVGSEELARIKAKSAEYLMQRSRVAEATASPR